MAWSPTNIQRAAGMVTSNRKALVLVLMLLLSRLTCDAHKISECCRQPSRSCPLHALLCRSSSPLAGDASAGILTLGKRGEEEHRLQSRLHQLLHGSRNQAAGILTVGRRTEESVGEQYMDRLARSETPITAAIPV